MVKGSEQTMLVQSCLTDGLKARIEANIHEDGRFLIDCTIPIEIHIKIACSQRIFFSYNKVTFSSSIDMCYQLI